MRKDSTLLTFTRLASDFLESHSLSDLAAAILGEMRPILSKSCLPIVMTGDHDSILGGDVGRYFAMAAAYGVHDDVGE